MSFLSAIHLFSPCNVDSKKKFTSDPHKFQFATLASFWKLFIKKIRILRNDNRKKKFHNTAAAECLLCPLRRLRIEDVL
jgi:hypothetical protein